MAPPSARRLLPGLVLSASLLSLSLCGVSAYESLTVTSPSLYPASAGLVYQKPSLFGLPNFREKIAGQVIWPEADTNPFGCAPYQAFVPADAPPGLTPTLIALIDRGNCTFSQKVLNAQNAGAQAVIVVNNEAVYGNFLPFLYAGPEGSVPTPHTFHDHERRAWRLMARSSRGCGLILFSLRCVRAYLCPSSSPIRFHRSARTSRSRR